MILQLWPRDPCDSTSWGKSGPSAGTRPVAEDAGRPAPAAGPRSQGRELGKAVEREKWRLLESRQSGSSIS